MEKFIFNPPEGFLDVDAFPDPSSENETREQMQRLHNQLADFVNKIAVGYNGEVVMIRFDSELRLEYSRNGIDWFPTMTSGHIVMDPIGTQLPNRHRLQFKNAVIRDDSQNGATIVECSTGEAGPGVPEGGEPNQVLVKSSASSFDTSWKTLNAADVGAASYEQVQEAAHIASMAAQDAAQRAPANHNHDTRYFTQDQTSALLMTKVNRTELGMQVDYSLSGTTLTIKTI